MPSPIRWAFFDVGDVLFNEDPPHLLLFHTCLATLRSHGKPVLYDAFDRRRIEVARNAAGSLGPTIEDAMASFCDGPEEAKTLWHEARATYAAIRKPRPYGVLLDGIQPMLQRLKPLLQLGAIANQHPECLDGMKNYGLGEQLSVMVISEIAGLYKPDPAIFQLALQEAGAAPEECVFVGDRPDDDVAPAKTLGMRTIRFRRGIQYIYTDARTDAETPDAEVTDISGLEAVLRGMV